MIRVNMTQEARQWRPMPRLLPEIIDPNLREFCKGLSASALTTMKGGLILAGYDASKGGHRGCGKCSVKGNISKDLCDNEGFAAVTEAG
jgi:hypothetical protein